MEYYMLEVQQRQNLSAAASRLLDYIERHPNAVLVSSALELAAKIDASDATVIRSIQTLGFDGLPHLKTVIAEKLDEGARTPVEKVGVTVSELTQDGGRPPLQMVVEAYARTLERLSRPTLPEQFQSAALLLNDASRIGLHGGGPLVRLAQQTSTHLGRIGRANFVMEGTGHAFADALLGLQPDDAVILLAYGKVHKESLLIKEELQRIGGMLVVITDNPTGRLAVGAQSVLEVPRTEVGNMTFYGTILLALETLVLSLTQLGPDQAMETARRLRDFRSELDRRT
ncbi:MurR/RpiR family transcriptional regulator [Agrobacterium vitis]|uniref:MurR/RpiR family transcriptional regulator n=2 Tax=Agrobacterium vitis TaxID=373 RepID=A0A368NGX1_AGRVI|nr:MurR/RpiR family transcriptional regulator [Agrobacterium vitis]KAA3509345.1 MurR/RpiR family transcriptional regulator [Agrobacterium vitis]KAA3522387.1 MurR/RpiR family transcriptional regulator [Agrobacterium vitis]NSZ50709.1 MurR/RpiR family transcriptional regulator [Agrobacterium vitis]RCU49718.1 MurR/RpiR family transcriptional regulator [Agrobacterium vitis]UJL75852.1 MurR/RpiR family transcriptional regulator [Agrobacterium vitis]